MFVFLNKMQTYYNVKALSFSFYISAELNVIEQDPYYIISISFMFKKKTRTVFYWMPVSN